MKRNTFNKLSAVSSQLSAIGSKVIAHSSWLIALMIMTSCEPAPWTNGKATTEVREFEEDFSSLYFYDDINITLVESDTCRIEITTGENLMPQITSNVIDGALYLKNENIRYWLRSYDYPLDIKVYHKNIRYIHYESWGDLKSEGYVSKDTINKFDLIVAHGSGHIDLKLNCDTLNVYANDGTSKITVAGTADYTYLHHNARNNIYALDLTTKDATANIHYEGSIYVNCIDTLNANVYNFGNIYYKGEPQKLNTYISSSATGTILPY